MITAEDGKSKNTVVVKVEVAAGATEVTTSDELAAALVNTDVDTIYLADGNYQLTTSNNQINRDLTIIGSENTRMFAADGSGQDSLLIAGGEVTIKNITFKGSKTASQHGLTVNGSSKVVIENCVFDDLYSGIWFNGGEGSVKNCEFTYSGTMNAMNVDGLSGVLTVEDCAFDGPATQKDIYCANASTAMKVEGEGFTIGF